MTKGKTEWFRHDVGTESGRKFRMLRMKGGYEAHGIYWAVASELYKSSNCYPFATAEEKKVLAESVHLDVEKLENFIQQCVECENLLKIVDGKLLSPRIEEELASQRRLTKKRRIAGSKGGKISSSKRQARLEQNSSKGQPITIQDNTIQDITGHNKTTHTSKGALSSADFVFPEPLSNSKCKELVDEYIQLRREMKKPVTKTQLNRILKKYATKPDEFTRDFEHSLDKGYQGIYPPGEAAPPRARGPSGPSNDPRINTILSSAKGAQT